MAFWETRSDDGAGWSTLRITSNRRPWY